MDFSRRFKLLLAAVLIFGTLVLWPLMRRMNAMNRCLAQGSNWDYPARRCEAPVNPHPSVN